MVGYACNACRDQVYPPNQVCKWQRGCWMSAYEIHTSIPCSTIGSPQLALLSSYVQCSKLEKKNDDGASWRKRVRGSCTIEARIIFKGFRSKHYNLSDFKIFQLNASLRTYSHGHSLTLVRLLDNHNINDGTLNGEKRSNTLLTRYYNIQKFQIKQHASLWL